MVETRWQRERARLFGGVPWQSPGHYAIGGGWVGGSGNQGGGTLSGYVGSHGGDEDHYYVEDPRYDLPQYGPVPYPQTQPQTQQSRESCYEPDYLRWRQNEIRRMDAEYEAYCRDRQRRFGDQFVAWRENREDVAPEDKSE